MACFHFRDRSGGAGSGWMDVSLAERGWDINGIHKTAVQGMFIGCWFLQIASGKDGRGLSWKDWAVNEAEASVEEY